ncbi:MAG TPA: glycosyltransferase [archaeon]|nr:glycosyltransferase [archaeon]
MPKPDLSIATVNWNGKAFLESFFSSIEKQKFPKHSLEVVMIDNGSSDGSVNFVEKHFPFVKIIQLEKNVGFSKAANIAYESCMSDFVMVAGNDTILPEDFGKNFLSEAKDFGAAITVANDYPFGSDLSTFRPMDTINIICGNSVGVVKDYNSSAIPRCAVFIADKKQVGERLFDPDYFAYGDDTWMCFRLLLQGKKILYSKKCKVWHYGAGTGSRISTLSFFTERNRLLNIITFFKLSTIIKILPLIIFDFLVKFFSFLLTGNLKRMSNFLKAHLWFILYFEKVLQKREKIQKERRLNDDILVSKMSYKLYGHQRTKDSFLFKLLDLFSLNYCKLVRLRIYEIDKNSV